MKKIAFIFLCIFFISSAISGYTAFAAETRAVKRPEVAAQGAVLMDAKTGRVLWGKNENEPLPMASTTKIMTAVLALESGRMNETVTISKRAAAAPEVSMKVNAGEKLRLGDLLYALMLESSNDAAIAIAEHLGGSVETFCAQMTGKAAEIGAKDTVFETPNGLDAGNHHSTAYDMALITRYALTVPGFIELTNTPSASFTSDKRSYSFNNRNRLLHEFNGANGVKTGFTGRAGHCFVGAAKRGDMQLISVVLASGWGDKGKAKKWTDTKEILTYGFNHFAYETILTVGEAAGTLPVTRSRSASLDYVYSDSLRLPLNQKEKEAVKINVNVPDSIPAPVHTGDPVGTATITINGKKYGEIILTAAGDIIRHDLKTSLEKVFNAWLSQGTEQPVKLILPEF